MTSQFHIPGGEGQIKLRLVKWSHTSCLTTYITNLLYFKTNPFRTQ